MRDNSEGNLLPANNNKRILIGLGVTIVLCLIAVLFKFKSMEKNIQPKIEPLRKTSFVSNDFFKNARLLDGDVFLLAKEKEKAKINAEKKDIDHDDYFYLNQKYERLKATIEKEKNLATDLTAKTAFLQFQKTKEQLLNESIKKINRARRSRAVWNYGIKDNAKTFDNIRVENKEKQLTDKDFGKGVPKNISTFPIDLSRVITTDKYIPCLLKEHVNSEVEGRVTCQIERNVYGFMGRFILLPAGSIAQGKHTSIKKAGQKRINIKWSRILRPDGVYIGIKSDSADRTGASGIEGVVDNRTWDKYGQALLTSSISVIAQASLQNSSSNISNSVVENYGTDLGQVTSTLLEDKIDIKPISNITAGTRILITPTTDIWLKDNELKQVKLNNKGQI